MRFEKKAMIKLIGEFAQVRSRQVKNEMSSRWEALSLSLSLGKNTETSIMRRDARMYIESFPRDRSLQLLTLN